MNRGHSTPRAYRLAIAVAAIALGFSEVRAEQPNVKIVGIGATSCVDFLSQARETPVVQRDYLAWTQGFMSAISADPRVSMRSWTSFHLHFLC